MLGKRTHKVVNAGGNSDDEGEDERHEAHADARPSFTGMGRRDDNAWLLQSSDEDDERRAKRRAPAGTKGGGGRLGRGGGRGGRAARAGTAPAATSTVTSGGWRNKQGQVVAGPDLGRGSAEEQQHGTASSSSRDSQAGGSADQPMSLDVDEDELSFNGSAQQNSARYGAVGSARARGGEKRAAAAPSSEPAGMSSSMSPTEEEEDEEEEEEEDPEPEPLCWPPNKPRCPFDAKGCYRQNPRHLLQEAHCIQHVRKRAQVIDWMHDKGPLARLVTEGGLSSNGTDCSTRDACLAALNAALDVYEVAARSRAPEAELVD